MNFAARLLVLLVPAALAAQRPVPTVLLRENAVAVPVPLEAQIAGPTAVASNGETFLVVTAASSNVGGLFVYAAALVDREGRPLREASAHATDCGGRPAVASDGRGYLAVFGCRGGTRGLLVDSSGTARSVDIHPQTRPQLGRFDVFGERAVAWDGAQYVVVTTVEPGYPNEAYDVATPVSADGVVIGADVRLGLDRARSAAARNAVTVGVSLDGFAAFNMSGAASATVPLSGARAVGIAAGPDGFLLVWSAESILGWHLDSSGRPDRTPFVVSSTPLEGYGTLGVASEPNGYRVVWNDGKGRIASIRAGPDRVFGTTSVVAAGDYEAVAADQETTLLAWRDGGQPSGPTRARQIDLAGNGHSVHRLAGAQTLTGIALDASGPAITWKESGTFSTALSRLQRLDSLAPPLTNADYLVLRGSDRPLVMSRNGPSYVAYFANRPEERVALPGPRVFSAGGRLLAIWTDRAPDTDPFAVMPLYAQWFEPGTGPANARPLVIGQSLDFSRHYVSSAALNVGAFAGSSHDQVLIAYVDPAGGVQGTIIGPFDAVIPVGEIAPPNALANPVEVTSDGVDFLVTWISGMRGTNAYIASRRVLANGTMPAAIAINSSGDETKDAMATFWTGVDYLVAWATVAPGGRHIFALRLDREGKLLDNPPQPIGVVEGTNAHFAYRNGLLAIAYERQDRVFWRLAATARQRAVR